MVVDSAKSRQFLRLMHDGTWTVGQVLLMELGKYKRRTKGYIPLCSSSEQQALGFSSFLCHI